MAIDALDGGSGAWFAVELAVTMDILTEMTVDTMHPASKVDILQVNRPGKFVRVIGRDRFVIKGQQLSVAVFLENGAKDPAVPVVIGELGVLQLRIQFGYFFQEVQIAPKAARSGG